MTRVLVVDDEPMISMMIEACLSDLGCEVLGPVETVAKALLYVHGEHIDAAIIDVSLRNETSYPVAQALRQKGVPFAFSTGHGRAGIDSGFKDEVILSKPFDFENVRMAIDKLLSVR